MPDHRRRLRDGDLLGVVGVQVIHQRAQPLRLVAAAHVFGARKIRRAEMLRQQVEDF